MVRAFTLNNWNFIAVVLPNLVTFLKEKATGDWKRRQHELMPDYNPIEDALGIFSNRDNKFKKWENLTEDEKGADSLFNLEGIEKAIRGEDENGEPWKELPKEEAEQLWEECKSYLKIEGEVTPTEVTY